MTALSLIMNYQLSERLISISAASNDRCNFCEMDKLDNLQSIPPKEISRKKFSHFVAILLNYSVQ